MGGRGGRDGIIEVVEVGAESREQVQTLVTALRGIGRQGEGLELGEAGATEKLGAAGEALVQGEGVHAIFEHGLDPHQAEAMHQESPELPRGGVRDRSEELTSELQSPDHLVCRLLLEKK